MQKTTLHCYKCRYIKLHVNLYYITEVKCSKHAAKIIVSSIYVIENSCPLFT